MSDEVVVVGRIVYPPQDVRTGMETQVVVDLETIRQMSSGANEARALGRTEGYKEGRRDGQREMALWIAQWLESEYIDASGGSHKRPLAGLGQDIREIFVEEEDQSDSDQSASTEEGDEGASPS